MEHEPDDEPLLRSTRLPPVTPASLRSSLDDREARAQELRDALDDLRAELDGGPRRADRDAGDPADAAGPQDGPEPAEPEPAGGRRRPLALLVLAAAGVVLAAVGVVRVVAWSLEGPPGPGTPALSASGAPRASAPPSASPAVSPTPLPSPPAEPARADVVLPRGLPGSGPGADAPGAEMTALLGPGGTVDVYERLVVRAGTTSVRLEPAPASTLPRGLGGARTGVAGLEVAVDGRGVAARADGGAWQVGAADGAAFTRVAVHYRLEGALIRVAPAPPGRATLVLRPLAGPAAGAAGDPVLVRLDDPRVGAVYCPAAPQPLCAVSSGARHLATVPAGARPVVLAQVTRS